MKALEAKENERKYTCSFRLRAIGIYLETLRDTFKRAFGFITPVLNVLRRVSGYISPAFNILKRATPESTILSQHSGAQLGHILNRIDGLSLDLEGTKTVLTDRLDSQDKRSINTESITQRISDDVRIIRAEVEDVKVSNNVLEQSFKDLASRVERMEKHHEERFDTLELQAASTNALCSDTYYMAASANAVLCALAQRVTGQPVIIPPPLSRTQIQPLEMPMQPHHITQSTEQKGFFASLRRRLTTGKQELERKAEDKRPGKQPEEEDKQE
ncbi:unnamed protein product [Arabis nemorensis]|uniref:DUF1664 domain-containing protein n=1 Tax=Arabis nemorensis TaxID=586526 RepID=A0A565ARU8_9BRAS|nr:unnamed protein product [Arabis nemorensis]